MKKFIFAGVGAILVSVLLMLIFIISGIVSIPSGPAATVEKFENALNDRNADKAFECFGMSDSGWFTINDLPYSGSDVNLIPGEFEEVDGDPNRIRMQIAAIYTEDGQTNLETDAVYMFKSGGRWYFEF